MQTRSEGSHWSISIELAEECHLPGNKVLLLTPPRCVTSGRTRVRGLKDERITDMGSVRRESERRMRRSRDEGVSEWETVDREIIR